MVLDRALRTVQPRRDLGIAQALQQVIVGEVQFAQEMGGLTGRIALAGLALFLVSRQQLLRAFQIPGLIIVPLVFFYAIDSSVSTVKIGIFLAGFFFIAWRLNAAFWKDVK